MTDLSGACWGVFIPAVFLIAVVSTLLGLFIAVAVSEVFEAQDLTPTFSAFPWSSCAGFFFPVDKLPLFLKPLSYALPLTYGADALHGGIHGQHSPAPGRGLFPAGPVLRGSFRGQASGTSKENGSSSRADPIRPAPAALSRSAWVRAAGVSDPPELSMDISAMPTGSNALIKGNKTRVTKNGDPVRMNAIGLVCPRDGQFFAIEASHVDSDRFQAFLDEANKCVADTRKINVFILDNASWHKKKTLDWGVFEPMFLPPYSPDLNPIERIWLVMKAK